MRRLVSLAALAALAACTASSTNGPSTISLAILSSAASAPPSVVNGPAAAPPVVVGDPTSLEVGMYAMYISHNTDCSNAVPVVDHGSTLTYRDFVQGDTLFTGTPADGSYPCIAIHMSDVIRFQSASAGGSCQVGPTYENDIYRDGETDWHDLDHNAIVGTGTDSVPANDQVWIIFSTDTTAAQAAGFSTHQTIYLASPLVVPGAATFYWDGTNSVTDDGALCGIQPGVPQFH